jgi:CBS domain containing-hemolysin-like protein
LYARIIILIVLFLNIVFIASAHAYIDPNTGGFFFQTVAPFVYGLLGVIVVFWKRITGFFKGLFGRKKEQDNSSHKS